MCYQKLYDGIRKPHLYDNIRMLLCFCLIIFANNQRCNYLEDRLISTRNALNKAVLSFTFTELKIFAENVLRIERAIRNIL